MDSKDSKLNVKLCNNDKEWDIFLYKSENKNFLSFSKIINSSISKCKKYFIYKEQEIVASFHIYEENNKIISGEQIYTPIHYKLNNKPNKSSEYYKKFLILEKYIDFITKNYEIGEITLDYLTEDLRALMWFNFTASKDLFKISEIKYTSVINLNNLDKNFTYENLESSQFYSFLSRSIKQQYKSSKKDTLEFYESDDLKYAKEIINNTFERQNRKNLINLSIYEENFYKFKENKELRLFYTSKKNKIVSFTLFGVVLDTAKYLHGGRLIDSNKDYSLTFNMLSSILKLKKDNVNSLDLEGINSPTRGFWKLGFGGDIKPYFKFKFKNN
tara:strand:+ start:547 stop:1533 length:987 start_codon:yes stop_codon:yes gene_type:complete